MATKATYKDNKGKKRSKTFDSLAKANAWVDKTATPKGYTEVVLDSDEQPSDTIDAKPTEAELTAEAVATVAGDAQVMPASVAKTMKGKKSTPKAKPAKEPKAKPAKEPKAKKVKEPKPTTNFLLCVGASHYKTVDDFVNEAAEQGVSRRMPSHFLPDGLAILGSKVWLVHGSGRKGDTSAVVFGHFTPSAVEFIAGPKGETKYADVIGELMKRTGDKATIVVDTSKELPRKCGTRKVGGTYLVTTSVEGTISPLVRTKDQAYVGHSFRGLMALTDEQAAALEAGKGLTTLSETSCDVCGKSYLAAPDTFKRKATEDRRVERGDERKWISRCPDCMKEHRAKLAKERAEARKADSSEGEVA